MATALRQPHYGPLLRGDDDISRPLLTRNRDEGATRRRRWNPLLAVTCAWWLFFLRWCAFGNGRTTAAIATVCDEEEEESEIAPEILKMGTPPILYWPTIFYRPFFSKNGHNTHTLLAHHTLPTILCHLDVSYLHLFEENFHVVT